MAKATTKSHPILASQARASEAPRLKADIAAEMQAMKAETEAAPTGPVTELEKKLTADVERLNLQLADYGRWNRRLHDTNETLRSAVNTLAEQLTDALRLYRHRNDDAIPF